MPRLAITLKPSKILSLVWIGLYGGAMLWVVQFLPFGWGNGVLCGLLGSIGYYQLCRYAWLTAPSAVISLEYLQSQWWLITRKGTRISVQLMEDSLVTYPLMLLRFVDRARTQYSVIVCGDMVPAAQRKLLVMHVRCS